jgi:hypothetical protein
MKNRRIEICPVWPAQSVNFRVDVNLRKNRRVLQGTIQFPLEDRTEIDRLRRAVFELYAQSERPDFLKRYNSMNFMRHIRSESLQGLNLNRRPAFLQRFPIGHQLLLM